MMKDAIYTADESGSPTNVELKESRQIYRRNNVSFLYGSRERAAMTDYRNHYTVHIRATDNINEATELYISYVKYY